MRKGQLLGNIIVFVIGLIVVTSILFFGYKVIDGTIEKSCEVQRVQFSTQFSEFVKKNRGWGTSKAISLEVPCETTHVCFADRGFEELYSQNPIPAFGFLDDKWENVPANAQTVIKSSLRAGVPTNVFTIQATGEVLPVEKFASISAAISVTEANEPRIRCIAAQADIIDIRMSGDGSLVEITEQ